MLYRVVAQPEAQHCTTEAEGVSYTRLPERIIDADGERIDFSATLFDYRNWRGIRGHKEQAVLLWLLRQWNVQPKTTAKALRVSGVISMRQIRRGTGMDPDTIDGALTRLGQKGIISVSTEKAGTAEARYIAHLRLPVSEWQLPHIHKWQEPRVIGFPF